MRHPGGDPNTRRRRLLTLSRFTETPRHLIVELNTYLLDLSGERYDERRALLASYGYRCYVLTKSGRIVAQTEPIVTRDVAVADLLFAA